MVEEEDNKEPPKGGKVSIIGRQLISTKDLDDQWKERDFAVGGSFIVVIYDWLTYRSSLSFPSS